MTSFKNLILYTALTGFFLSLISCGDSRAKFEGFAAIENEGDDWGMINTDGEMIFSDEFKITPSAIVNDRFFVQSEGGYLELYKPGKNPEKIKGNISQAMEFYYDRVPVITGDNELILIDKDGETVKSLKTLDGKKVQAIYNFQDKVAVFQADGLYGAMDFDGEVIISPEYAGMIVIDKDHILGIDKRYKDQLENNEFHSYKLAVLNGKGELVNEIPMKNKIVAGTDIHGKNIIFKDSDGDGYCGIMNLDGDIILDSKNSKYDYMIPVDDDLYIVSSDSETGVIDSDGKILIRLKYKYINYGGDGYFFVKKDYGDKFRIIDIDGNTYGDEYQQIWALEPGKTFAAEEDENDWRIIDVDGEYLNKKHYYNIAAYSILPFYITVSDDSVPAEQEIVAWAEAEEEEWPEEEIAAADSTVAEPEVVWAK